MFVMSMHNLLHFWLPTCQPAFFLHPSLQNHPLEGFLKSPWHVRWYYIHGKSRLWYTRISICTYRFSFFQQFHHFDSLTALRKISQWPSQHSIVPLPRGLVKMRLLNIKPHSKVNQNSFGPLNSQKSRFGIFYIKLPISPPPPLHHALAFAGAYPLRERHNVVMKRLKWIKSKPCHSKHAHFSSIHKTDHSKCSKHFKILWDWKCWERMVEALALQDIEMVKKS